MKARYASIVAVLSALFIGLIAIPSVAAARQADRDDRLARISEETGLVASYASSSLACRWDNSYALYLCPQPTPAVYPQRDPNARTHALSRLQGGASLLLVPDSTADRVMAFDPDTGNLIDANFIPADPTNLQTPINAILSSEGDSILVSDQIEDLVSEYDLDGTYLGAFVPAGGVNTAILDNMRGIELRPNGNLLVTVGSGGNAGAVAEFSPSGTYIGQFIAPGTGGLASPFDIYRRTSDYLTSDSTTDDVNRYDLNGAFISLFDGTGNFPEQIQEAANGNVLVANFSGATTEGIYEYTAAGVFVGRYDPTGLSGYRGVHELGNGNLLVTTGVGVHEITRANVVVRDVITGASGRFIEEIALTVAGGSITLDKTVSANDECGTSSTINVTYNTPVYYCYEVTNNGTVTFTLHDLTDSELGPLFTDLPFTLTPGSSIDTVAAGLEFSVTLTESVTNTATWTASAGATTATATDTATVNVGDPEPEIEVLPIGGLIESHNPSPQVTTRTLTIDNTGFSSLTFTIFEDDERLRLFDTRPDTRPGDASADRGTATAAFDPIATVPHPFGGASPIYAVDVRNDDFDMLATDTPTATVIAPRAESFFAGDFANDDFTALYAISNDTNQLFTINTATGATTLVGPTGAPPTGESWSDLSWDRTTSTMYAATTDATDSNLHTINLATGAATFVANVPQPILIDMAVEPTTGQLYGIETTSDRLIQINKATGAITPVGALGFPANFAQGMDFDDSTGILYWAAYRGATVGPAELRTINIATGASTAVGTITNGTPTETIELDAFAVAAAGGQGGPAICDAPIDIPWFELSDYAGTVPAGGAEVIDASFDSTGLADGVYTATLCIESNDSDEELTQYPVTLTVGIGGGGNGAITLDKTVGVDPSACAANDNLSVASGTDVYYCYTVTNTGDVTFTLHDLVDSELGSLLNDFPFVLAPGASAFVTETTLITQTTVNTATWTAFTPAGYSVETDTYAFDDISTSGTALNLTDDGEANVTLPFAFSFNNVSSSDVRVGNNGVALFGVTTGEVGFTNEDLPTALFGAAFAPFWDDLDEETGNVYFGAVGVAPNRVAIIQWENRSHFPGAAGGNGVTFQLRLEEATGDVVFSYEDVDFGDPATNNGVSATVGIQLDATNATQYSFNTASLSANLTLRFSEQETVSASDSDSATVTVVSGAPEITVNPASFNITHNPTPQTTTSTLTIGNTGSATLTWSIFEDDSSGRLLPARGFDASPDMRTGNGAIDVIIPSAKTEGGIIATVPHPFGGSSPIYAVDVRNGNFDVLATDNPTVTEITALAQTFFAGDFINDDFTKLYAIDNTDGNLYTIATATGVPTLVGSTGGSANGETWSDLIWDSDTNTLYALSTGATSSTLYTINPATGAATVIAPVAAGLVIDGGIDPTTGQMYGIEINTDTLLTINKATGAITTVGPLGFPAQFAQGADFDDSTGIFYWAAYRGAAVGPAELRTINTATGASTVIGTITNGDPSFVIELDAFAVAAPSGPGEACDGTTDIPWLELSDTSDTVAPGGSDNVSVVFDSTGLADGTYTAALCVESNDADEPLTTVPVTLTVGGVTSVTLGELSATQTSLPVAAFALAGLALLAAVGFVLRKR